MNAFLKISAFVAVAAFAAFPAVAASTTAPVHKVATAKPKVITFKMIDTNHDGKISFVELKKYDHRLTKGEFAKADTNHNGWLDRKELAAFWASLHHKATTSKMAPKTTSKMAPKK